jgi:NADH-quinone oxidoreductase subunit J
MTENIVCGFLAVMTLVPAALAVTVRNIFHAALWMVVCLSGVAGFFALAGADFLFVAQLLVYAGGILILLLFVVLLSGSPKDWAARAVNERWLPSVVVAAAFVTLLAVVLKALPSTVPPAGSPEPSTAALGRLILRDFLVPFEAVSFLLLAALIGAVHFSRKEDPAP